MKNIITTNTYCKEQFGQKVYKLALSAATDCPNRADGSGGCIFCSAGGSGEFASPVWMEIDEQIALAKQRVRAKTGAKQFIAYFQGFTGTFGDIDFLRARYMAAVKRDDIAALSVATRPDCLGTDVMAMLRDIAKVKPLWIELGLQTVHDESARRINRGYPLTVYEQALDKLRSLDVHIITHVMLGLPGETTEQMLESVSFAGRKSDGIKLHTMYVLRNTRLAEWYQSGQVTLPEREQYIDTVVRALEVLPEGVVVHRMTGDAPRRQLIAPLWSLDKKRVLNDLHREIARHGMNFL